MPRPSRMRSMTRPNTVGLGSCISSVRSVRIERPDHLADVHVAPADGDLEARGRRPARACRPPWRGARRPAWSSRRRRTSRARISLPRARLTVSSSWLTHCLILCRARAVRTWLSQSRLGLARGAGEDLDRVAALELAVQRRDPAVDLGALALEPDLGVHVEREVDRRRALGQPLHVALRREDEDLVLVEVDLQELEELLGAVGVLLQLEQLAEPAEVLVELVGLAVALVEPVGRDAELGRAVHLLGADLHLEELPARTEDGGVERLVGVRLGARDVVLDPLLDRRPVVVDDAEHVIALGHRAHDDPDGHQVVDLVERPCSASASSGRSTTDAWAGR